MSYNISFHSADASFVWEDDQTLSNWLSDALTDHAIPQASINYVYCTDEYLLGLNRSHLSHDYYTDILTFDLSDSPDILDVECYISLDRVKDNASKLSVSFAHELCRVMIHGLLHVLGNDDNTPDATILMRQEEDRYLSLLADVPRGTFDPGFSE